jgi:hypothetical protein
MAHPLNRALYDASRQRVVEGYGILQPRIAVSLPSAGASRYELLCGGETGIDPYTRTVSDVYQDIFGEGSFVGKGIYDVDAFEQTLKDRMPENRVLSHDLLEGCYARAGLLSDVQLYEQYPSRYSADAGRRHRWIRGDWQIASWLLPRVPGARDAASGKIGHHRNPLSALSRWKLHRPVRADGLAAGRLDWPAFSLVLDRRRARHRADSLALRQHPEPAAQAGRCAAAATPFGIAACNPAAFRPCHADPGFPAV